MTPEQFFFRVGHFECIKVGDRDTLEKEQANMMLEYKDLKKKVKGDQEHPPEIADHEFNSKCEELSQSTLAVMHSVLQRAQFKEKAPCLFCKQDCYVSPRSDPKYANSRWTEVAGNTCRPWSKMGGQNGMLDPATLVMLVWIYSMRYYEPDDIVDECVVGFDPSILQDVLNDDDPEIPKHHASRPTSRCETGHRNYDMFTIKFRPPDVGIPSNGLRMFAWLRLAVIIKSCVPPGLQRQVFESLFFCKCSLDASVYMVDCALLRDKFRFEWAGRRPEDSWWSIGMHGRFDRKS